MQLLVERDRRGYVLVKRKRHGSAQFASPHSEEDYALLFRALLHYQRVEFTQISRQFRFLPQHLVDLLNLGV
jgi:hypothetical protein